MIKIYFVVLGAEYPGPYRLFYGDERPAPIPPMPHCDDRSGITLYHPLAGDPEHCIKEDGRVRSCVMESAALISIMHANSPDDEKISRDELNLLIEEHDGKHSWCIREQTTGMTRVPRAHVPAIG